MTLSLLLLVKNVNDRINDRINDSINDRINDIKKRGEQFLCLQKMKKLN